MSIADPAADLRPLTTVMPAREYLAAMWARRDFAVALPFEEVRSTHQDTLLGNLWHLANPMLSVAVYYLVFGVMLDVSRGIDNYILFLMVGVFTFNLTTRCVLGGATAISSQPGADALDPLSSRPAAVLGDHVQAVHVRLRAHRDRRRRHCRRARESRCAGCSCRRSSCCTPASTSAVPSSPPGSTTASATSSRSSRSSSAC